MSVSARRCIPGLHVWVALATGLAFGSAVGRADDDPARVSRDGIWETVELGTEGSPADAGQEPWVNPEEFRLALLRPDALADRLAHVPHESTVALRETDTELSLPMPDGTFARFRVAASPVMAAELAAKFPQIKTYVGQGVDDPLATLRFDWTPAGFHAQVLSPNGAVYVDPYVRGNTTLYATYYKRDHRPPADAFSCLVRTAAEERPDTTGASASLPSGETLQTYRLACAATGEYTAFHGGTVSAGMSAIVTAINRVTGIYEVEFAIRMELVADNDELVFTNATTDPYTNNDGFAMLSENQSAVDSRIGSGSYDIGHVFSTGGGGVAYLGVVCQSNWKARGVTGLTRPIGDAFYVDYVAHEMGHQFGGNHPFNGISGSCCCGNRNGSTAYEPGSGSTIMAYAGICGADNLQFRSDPYFHSVSFDEIRSYITSGLGRICSADTATGNDAPFVLAGLDYTIPKRTPFVLTASGSDPDGDPMTYCWEERDLGPANTLSAPDNGSSPLFRSFDPTTNPSRTFPRLAELLNNTTPTGEQLPTMSRTMNLRVTGRDHRAGGGGVDTDDTSVTVTATAGPFRITSPNTAVTWSQKQTVSWNVAGTDASPVNTSAVNILLSTDGGNTFPITLASATPNDGSESVTIPELSSSAARVKVEAVGNIFFDLSDVDFTIGTCSTSDAPEAEPDLIPKNRYLSLVPTDPGQDTALRVTFASLPSRFSASEGASMWVGPPVSISELSESTDGVTPPLFKAAQLSPDPYCMNWGSVGLLHVFDAAVVPDAVYEVQAVNCFCGFSAEESFSPALAIPTSRWGDVVGHCTADLCTPPNGVVDFNDIPAVVDKFLNFPGAPIKARADIAPDPVDNRVDFTDIPAVVDAFRGLQYPYSGP